MADDERERPDRPSYNVYRAGSGSRRKARGRGEQTKTPSSARPGGRSDADGGDEPSYNVYRSRRAGFGGPDLKGLRDRLGERRRAERRGEVKRTADPDRRPPWRRALKWGLVGAGVWVLLSLVLFVVSAQVQKGKLNDRAADLVGGNPLMAAFPQTILVIGTDMRPADSQEPGAETSGRCVRRAAQGDPPAGGCLPARADTLLLVRAGGGSFEKLSIPRDVQVDVPGKGTNKVNAAYALGGAALQIETVESFLGIDVDHVAIVDFEGFEELIDSLGGVRVRLTERFKSKVGGGAGQGGITLELGRGEHTLNGQEALVYARTRQNLRDPTETDLERARRQQQVLSGIKGRLASPLRLPYNFIKGPFIAWSAPKAMVTDMGGFTLPQLAFSAMIGGDPGNTILGQRNATESGGNIVVGAQECKRAVRRFLGEPGPRDPVCSPGAVPPAPVTDPLAVP